MSQPTDREIIARALELLSEGLLLSFLPQFLMREFGISAERAQRLAIQALRRRETQADD